MSLIKNRSLLATYRVTRISDEVENGDLKSLVTSRILKETRWIRNHFNLILFRSEQKPRSSDFYKLMCSKCVFIQNHSNDLDSWSVLESKIWIGRYYGAWRFLISNWQIQATLIGLKWAELPKTTYLLSRSYNRIPTGMLVPSKRMSELNEIV